MTGALMLLYRSRGNGRHNCLLGWHAEIVEVLAARMSGIIVASLLGGAVRDRLLSYACGPFLRSGSDPYRAYGREVDSCLQKSFRAIKPRGGFDPRTDGVMATGLRRQIGPDMTLMIDINQGYTSRGAIESARRMEEVDLLRIEGPVQAEDMAGYRAFTQAVSVAVVMRDLNRVFLALGAPCALRMGLCARSKLAPRRTLHEDLSCALLIMASQTGSVASLCCRSGRVETVA
jgi:hypothetical protein